MATLLVARDVPEAGGDTIFANQYLALAGLSDTLRAQTGQLTGVASSAKADASRTREDRIRSDGSADARKLLVAEHPVVRTHPETGRKALYVNRAHTVAFSGHDRGRKRAAAGIPVQPPDPSGVHLPLPLDAGLHWRSGTTVARSTMR